VKRGAIVVVAAKGAYTGKPRPALILQSDLFNPTHQSVTICPITSDCAFSIPTVGKCRYAAAPVHGLIFSSTSTRASAATSVS
jgi:PemK-like, MazF-like toxin of type II toxin-antitoxin system